MINFDQWCYSFYFLFCKHCSNLYNIHRHYASHSTQQSNLDLSEFLLKKNTISTENSFLVTSPKKVGLTLWHGWIFVWQIRIELQGTWCTEVFSPQTWLWVLSALDATDEDCDRVCVHYLHDIIGLDTFFGQMMTLRKVRRLSQVSDMPWMYWTPFLLMHGDCGDYY